MFFIDFFGGLAMFLFAMKLMSDNLNAVAGAEMKRILKKLTNTPFKGVLVGFVVTAITQSSTATSVMTIGLVNSHIMNLMQSIGVIMGANVGTTLTGQLIAFKLTDYAPIFIIIGIILLFFKRSKAMERWSMITLSFGLLFIGLLFMSDSVSELRQSTVVFNFMASLNDRHLVALLTGAIFTMIIQSSTATTAIVIVLAMEGLIGPQAAMYLVFGSNAGTTSTAWLASISVNRTGKRVALIHTMFNLFGAFVFSVLTFFGVFEPLINFVTSGNIHNTGNIARFVANTHTFFNLLGCLMFIPFAGLFNKVALFVIKENNDETISTGEPKHLHPEIINTGFLAIEQSVKEMGEMLILVKYSLETSMDAFLTKNYRKQEKVVKIENAIDQLQKEITQYLVSVNENSRSDLVGQQIPALLHTVNDMEKLGDYAEQINQILNNQILGQKTTFYHEFILIINSYHAKILNMIELTLEYLSTNELSITYRIVELEGRINQQHIELRKKIISMIQNAQCDAESGLNAIDYIDTIELLGDKLKNVVKAGSYNFIYPHRDRQRFDFSSNENGSEEK